MGCFRLEVSGDLMSVHVGDKILEVNGLPVRDQSLKTIEDMLRSSHSTIQVCIDEISSIERLLIQLVSYS